MKIKLLDKMCWPDRAHKTDSGLDLRARLENNIWIYPGQVHMIPAGIAIEIPDGCEAQVRGRSGWTKRGIVVPTGTIDYSYRGEIMVTVINVTNQRIEIAPYNRIAQLVVCPIIIPQLEYVDELSYTHRWVNGHGSTGVE